MKDFKVIGRRYVRARRAHKCEFCEREIGAGDLYYEEFRKKVCEFGSFFDSWEKRLLKARKAWLSNLTSN
jgi:hypothetical protein